VSDDLIVTPRLELHLIGAADLVTLFHHPEDSALWADKPYVNPHRVLMDDKGPLAWRVPQVEADPGINRWLVRLMVDRTSREIVGSTSFHGPPDEAGMLEIGLGVAESFRNRGLAKEALLGMWTWGCEQPDARSFRYTVSPTNEPSIALIRHFGFAYQGQQIDEIDGPEDIYEMATSEFTTRFLT
jgi:[ribosomal protein S5]-alanine N-acetyltransferase